FTSAGLIWPLRSGLAASGSRCFCFGSNKIRCCPKTTHASPTCKSMPSETPTLHSAPGPRREAHRVNIKGIAISLVAVAVTGVLLHLALAELSVWFKHRAQRAD